MEQSSVDVYAFAKKDFSGARINKIYKIKDIWILDIYKKERSFVKIMPGGIWLSKSKTQAASPGGFVMQLRKHLEGRRIDEVRQLNWDRVIEFKVGECSLIAELFGKGNMILVKNGKIIGCEKRKEWKHRKIRPGEPYIAPPSGKNFLKMDWEEFSKLEGPVGKVLVRDLSLGEYGKRMADSVEKKLFEEIEKEEKRSLFDKSKKLIEEPPEKDWENLIPEKEKKESKELSAMKVSFESQKKSVEENLKRAKILREEGEMIFRKMGEVEALLREARAKLKTGEEMSKGRLLRAEKKLELELD